MTALDAGGQSGVGQGIHVTVRAHAELARRLAPRAATFSLSLPPGASVRDLVRVLALGDVRSLVVGVNGTAAPGDKVLRDGDRVDLVTPMAGGR